MSSTDTQAPTPAQGSRPWMRGVYMALFLLFFAVAETVLTLVAVVQFGWMLAYRAPQPDLRRFGVALGAWLAEVARFQSGETEEKPFPWGDWPGKK